MTAPLGGIIRCARACIPCIPCILHPLPPLPPAAPPPQPLALLALEEACTRECPWNPEILESQWFVFFFLSFLIDNVSGCLSQRVEKCCQFKFLFMTTECLWTMREKFWKVGGLLVPHTHNQTLNTRV